MTAEATVSKLLEDWYRAMSPNWSPTTARQTRSVIDCHLVPRPGDVRLQTLRAGHIDAFYGELRRGGGATASRSRPARCIGCTSSCAGHFPTASLGMALGQPGRLGVTAIG
jgi:hypothetical protein